jgi:hypothetical protein
MPVNPLDEIASMRDCPLGEEASEKKRSCHFHLSSAERERERNDELTRARAKRQHKSLD